MGQTAQVLTPNLEATRIEKLNEDIEIPESTGSFEALTTNGSIRARNISGPLMAHSMNGDVEVWLESDPEEQFDLISNNGDIRLILPKTANVNIVARATNGRINTEFTSTMEGDVAQDRVEALIGKGGPQMTLLANNGNIQIKRFG